MKLIITIASLHEVWMRGPCLSRVDLLTCRGICGIRCRLDVCCLMAVMSSAVSSQVLTLGLVPVAAREQQHMRVCRQPITGENARFPLGSFCYDEVTLGGHTTLSKEAETRCRHQRH